MGMPVTILVARHELEALSQVGRPASRDILRMSSFVSPHSLRGDTIPSSFSARNPGLSATSSDALVPSATIRHPSRCAASRMAPKILRLQW